VADTELVSEIIYVQRCEIKRMNVNSEISNII